ncbi:MAG TPA: 50S ribosomal protein L11 methyltransferase [Candidatus Udaeobacter sp.]|nr:50S ribosomal protein L11 methyltransferase [Candidatus Udaeobacter sp.]
MYQWSKLADLHWFAAHENVLQSQAQGKLVIVDRPGRKRLRLEVTSASQKLAGKLLKKFGGHIEKWPRNWLKRFVNLQRSKPLKIGHRLVISATVLSRPKRASVSATNYKLKGSSSPARLAIPASAAFGTGEHATTAMSLRLLENLTRNWEEGWSLADLGTGSGILALAAKCFGAGRVIGIDIDAKAISVAKTNARVNKIKKVNFQVGDIRNWNPRAGWDLIAANLYSELLIELLPKLRRSNWLILSGVLRSQEDKLLGVLRRNGFGITSVKRRGKWIAVSAYGKKHGRGSVVRVKNKICAPKAAS